MYRCTIHVILFFALVLASVFGYTKPDFVEIISSNLFQISGACGHPCTFLNKYDVQGASFFFLVNILIASMCGNLLVGFLLKPDSIVTHNLSAPSILDKHLWGSCWPHLSFHIKKQEYDLDIAKEAGWRALLAVAIGLIVFPYTFALVGNSTVLSVLRWQGIVLIDAIAFWVLFTETIALLIVKQKLARRA